MRDTDYTYAVAYIKTIENKMLSQKDIDTLIAAKTKEECIKILIEHGYGLKSENNIAEKELLDAERKKAWDAAASVCQKEDCFKILLCENDFHNLKAILKAKIAGVDWERLILKPYITEPEKIDAAIKSGEFKNLPDFIKNPARLAYEMIIKTNNAQITEIFLDKSMLEAMRERSIETKNKFLIGWADLNILIANMKTAARTIGKEKSFIEEAMIKTPASYERSLCMAAQSSKRAVCDEISALGYPKGAECLLKDFQSFEKWCDNLKIKYIKKAKNKSFGIEAIIAFIIGKEFELQAVRIILMGKQNGADEKLIRERLRDLYV